MDAFFKWLSSNPEATITLIASFGIVIISVIFIYLVAFLQGREISFWPPKIGAKPSKTPKNSDSLTGIEILDMKKAFPQQIAQRAKAAKKFILDTNLNEQTPRVVYSSPQDEYRQIRDERVMKRQIAFRRVEVIFSKERLEKIIKRLLIFEGCEYYVRHYDAPPQAIPILHLMSFDGEHFYLGGFYPSDPATEQRAVYIHAHKLNELLQEYWQMLWIQAKPLNEGGRINWEELKRIGERFGIKAKDFNSLINTIKDEIQSQNRQT